MPYKNPETKKLYNKEYARGMRRSNPMTVKERFDSKWKEYGEDWIVDGVNKGKCWIWQGRMSGGNNTDDGYGRIRVFGKRQYAHRLGWEVYIGEIPLGLELDHIVCRNRMCVNPKHLRTVTHRINSIENSLGFSAVNSKKTHCIRGHELSIENCLPSYIKKGERQCKICRNNARRIKRREISGRKNFSTNIRADAPIAHRREQKSCHFHMSILAFGFSSFPAGLVSPALGQSSPLATLLHSLPLPDNSPAGVPQVARGIPKRDYSPDRLFLRERHQRGRELVGSANLDGHCRYLRLSDTATYLAAIVLSSAYSTPVRLTTDTSFTALANASKLLTCLSPSFRARSVSTLA
jgi:hypothetical protein